MSFETRKLQEGLQLTSPFEVFFFWLHGTWATLHGFKTEKIRKKKHEKFDVFLLSDILRPSIVHHGIYWKSAHHQPFWWTLQFGAAQSVLAHLKRGRVEELQGGKICKSSKKSSEWQFLNELFLKYKMKCFKMFSNLTEVSKKVEHQVLANMTNTPLQVVLNMWRLKPEGFVEWHFAPSPCTFGPKEVSTKSGSTRHKMPSFFKVCLLTKQST